MTAYRLFLVDDHGVFRSGVRAELAGEDGIDVVGDAGTVPQAISEIVATRPDVVLLDVHMPGGGGVGVLRGVTDALGSEAPVFLALSVSDAATDVIATIRA
ncbi:response regulator transcription factor, partial [Enterococcus casseliflavus]